MKSRPVVHDVLNFVKNAKEKITIIDLCSGFGFLSMLLSEILSPEKVVEIRLIDFAFEDDSSDLPEPQHPITRKHLDDFDWPIGLIPQRLDLQTQTEHVVHNIETNTIIIGIHLCGTLSIRAVEVYNKFNFVKQLYLKPCCMPGGKGKAKYQGTLQVGNHIFERKLLYERSGYAKKFQCWCDQLLLGIDSSDRGCKIVKISTTKEEAQRKNNFLFGERN